MIALSMTGLGHRPIDTVAPTAALTPDLIAMDPQNYPAALVKPAVIVNLADGKNRLYYATIFFSAASWTGNCGYLTLTTCLAAQSRLSSAKMYFYACSLRYSTCALAGSYGGSCAWQRT
jgi:hypothetical protein